MRKAFTLIEVMVVLSILAIIAILAYNFFGSTMKEASEKAGAIQIRKGLLAIESATETYLRENPNSTDISIYGTDDGTLQASVIPDYMKSLPTLPPGGEETACPNGRGYAWTLKMALNDSTFTPLATEDYVTALYCVKAGIAKKYNEMYANGMGYTLFDYVGNGGHPPRGEQSSYCYYITDETHVICTHLISEKQ